MSVQVASKMARNKLVKDTQGNIIDWYDDKQGGWIVQKGQIVNKQAWDAHVQREKDRREAAVAITKQRVDDSLPDRTQTPGKLGELEEKIKETEKKMSDMDTKLDAILNAIKK